MRQALVDLALEIRNNGTAVAPRGMPTRELLGASFQLLDPSDALPTGVGRQLNPGIAAVEALQLIAGETYPDLMIQIAPNFAQFTEIDRGGHLHFHGAYGPRAGWQTTKVIDKLKSDASSRQAVITMWEPHFDNETGHLDYPCTIGLHFMLRDDKLNLHTTMRSNDVWWGLTYDAFQFTQLQGAVANALGVPIGTYFHTANSLHLYERDFAKVDQLKWSAKATPNFPGFLGQSSDNWLVIQTLAKRLLRYAANYDDCDGFEDDDLDEVERWYLSKLLQ
jgi:thymidylate synthase